MDPSETGESSSGTRAFSGGGFRLGSDETPSTKVHHYLSLDPGE